jgi:NAD(P)-dependent dehydrogenase (short-subunit alcohol dehydrogenase family)
MTRTVLITGGSRGIGYATAELFARNGWQVALCSRSATQAKQAADHIGKETGARVSGYGADVGDATAIDLLFKELSKQFKTLDALVNNAAILPMGSVFELSDADFEESLRVNVTGMMRCCRHAFTLMKKHGGSIVNISSLAGIQGTRKLPGLWAYTASKFAVTGLTEGLAVEGEPYNIRVNCVAPGATDTQMLQQAAPGFKPRAVPADIAKIVYYLSDREQSAILNGTTIPVFSNG